MRAEFLEAISHQMYSGTQKAQGVVNVPLVEFPTVP
jgi:hypothetical protein